MSESELPSVEPAPSLRGDALNFVRGLMMGGADIVPGVSGGTVALIVGIFERLVTAISHFDLQLLRTMLRGHIGEAARRVDFRFLAALGAGVLCGMVLLGSLIKNLLSAEPTRSITWSAFFGMIVGSAWIVARRVRCSSTQDRVNAWVLGTVGAIFAFIITGLPVLSGSTSYPYIFFSGMIAICAMILPGISGAYLLLILGLYVYLTDILHGLAHGNVTGHDILVVIVFCTGCAIGIVSFSKVLKQLLARYETRTMAVLCGFILGAVRKVWPFQTDLTPDLELKQKQFAPFMPETIDGHVMTCFVVGVLAMVVVVVVDQVFEKA